jgi:SsrA-binding protein
MKTPSEHKILCTNRRARHEYEIEATFEAGVALLGTEVKSLRAGLASLQDAYARIEGGEAYLLNCHINPYEAASRFSHDPLRKRKLLLHKEEIRRLIGKVQEKGLTLIPLSFYLKEGKVKVELALARGKKLYDRREDLKRRMIQRELDQALKHKGSGHRPTDH